MCCCIQRVCLPLSVASSPFVLLLKLIEWCAVRPTGLPAAGLTASIARTSPFFWCMGRKNRQEDEERRRAESK